MVDTSGIFLFLVFFFFFFIYFLVSSSLDGLDDFAFLGLELFFTALESFCLRPVGLSPLGLKLLVSLICLQLGMYPMRICLFLNTFRYRL